MQKAAITQSVFPSHIALVSAETIFLEGSWGI